MTQPDAEESLDAQLERMLRSYEGPEAPTSAARRRRDRRLFVATALAAGVLVVGVAGYLLGGEEQPREATLQPSPPCGTLELDGRRYTLRRVRAGAFRAGPAAGTGTLRCGNETSATAAHTLQGIDAKVAVALPGVGDRVYAAEGLCPGLESAMLLSCLGSSPPPP